jgi:hypothetical protein
LAYENFTVDCLPHEGKLTPAEAQRIFEEFMDGAVSSGRIKAPGYFEHPNVRNACLNCVWKGLTAQTSRLSRISQAYSAISLALYPILMYTERYS